METRFTLFSQCYELFSANCPLCKHEVELLAFRCYQFGSWFPTNFPEANVICKFHVPTFHVSKKARLHWTVGMEAEQEIESVHPFVNKRNRTFASITNPTSRLTQVMRPSGNIANLTFQTIKFLLSVLVKTKICVKIN